MISFFGYVMILFVFLVTLDSMTKKVANFHIDPISDCGSYFRIFAHKIVLVLLIATFFASAVAYQTDVASQSPWLRDQHKYLMWCLWDVMMTRFIVTWSYTLAVAILT